jgi:hypothetical protein
MMTRLKERCVRGSDSNHKNFTLQVSRYLWNVWTSVWRLRWKIKCCLYVIIPIRVFSVAICNSIIDFLSYNVRLKFVIFCGHEHIYFDKNRVVIIFGFVSYGCVSNIGWRCHYVTFCVIDGRRANVFETSSEWYRQAEIEVIKEEPLISAILSIGDSI